MLFHLGCLRRLNELGLLPRLSRISSVSGGSITSGALGAAWNRLTFDANGTATNFDAEVLQPVYHLGQHTIDLPSIGLGALLPFVSVGEVLVREYNHYLFHGATLQDLPTPAPFVSGTGGAPDFVFNSTNLQSLALWRFSKDAMRDWRVGMVPNPTIDLAVAVAASSAFPPVLSPMVLRFREGEVQPMSGNDLHRPPYTTKVVLSDGGVYDNMGIETVWKRYTDVLVCDAGGKMSPNPSPKGDWAIQGLYVLSMGDNQVRNLRKREVVQSFLGSGSGHRDGAFWSIRSDPNDYPFKFGPYVATADRINELATLGTRLAGLEPTMIERLINWGYAMTDIGLQSWYAAKLPVNPAGALPFPNSGI